VVGALELRRDGRSSGPPRAIFATTVLAVAALNILLVLLS
jgi:hypothetical protein